MNGLGWVLTSRLIRRTKPADSATNIDVAGDAGSDTAARILDLRPRGLPFWLSALAAFLAWFS